MLGKRVLVVIVLLPIGLLLIWLGGIYFSALITLIMILAAWEYAKIMRHNGYQPAVWVILPAVGLLCITRYWNGFDYAPVILSLFILLSMTYHLVAYERGRDQAATDFAVTLAIILYLGWVGPYLISLRDLDKGEFWLLMTLVSVWVADSAAYFIGKKWGKHHLSPRLSPKKTWEGYLAGVVFGTIGGVLTGWILNTWVVPGSGLNVTSGFILGLVLSTVTTLGDLGESMIKRQSGVKDSSNLLPGHGGVFDRIDSWLWAGVISFYLITLIFIR